MAFWGGSAAVTAGVLLHLPMFVSARTDSYHLAGMKLDGWMIAGMALILAGFAAVFYGLAPRLSRLSGRTGAYLTVKALDEAPLRPAHYWLMAVLTVAIAVDTLKPFTFTFILPGVAKEYGLKSPAHPIPGALPVALLPLLGITGTVIGSFLWGFLADRIGRRASILLASIIFIGTAICGFMPAFGWNLVMCFVMGLGAGGLLPIAYSLLTETIPARHRGASVVLVAGIGTASGFLLASGAANWLVGDFSWRIMWSLGLPTGLILIVLNRFIPESPRYLLANGFEADAREVMQRFGVRVVADEGVSELELEVQKTHGFSQLLRAPFGGVTLALVLYGLGWGLVNFGFIVWLPIKLGALGLTTGHVTTILAKAALFSLPGAFVVSWLYGRWSSKYTMILVAILSVVTLLVFAAEGDSIATHTGLLTFLVVALLMSLWGVISVLAPYSAEVYPTKVRATGAGIAAGASKLGGVVALTMAVASIAPPSIAGAAVLTAAPMLLSAVVLGVRGVETRARRLEEISVMELASVAE